MNQPEIFNKHTGFMRIQKEKRKKKKGENLI